MASPVAANGLMSALTMIACMMAASSED